VAEPTAQNITLAIGQAKTITVTMDAAPVGGIVGWTMRFRLRKRGETVAIEKTTGSGITATDNVNGVWSVVLTGTNTATLDPEQYEWSFWRTDTNSETPVAFGFCTPYVTAEIG
jgi:N-methylhydantoinase B/oxoprolinase/acetone carboxylase alpha subunit